MSQRPLLVVALGGNAISPPAGDLSFTGERTVIAQTTAELAALARDGARLLVVHGDGPQVGRLLAAETSGGEEDLDILAAQTQGELGYLICEALDAELGDGSSIALVTRVLVDADDAAFGAPSKPIGPVLAAPPATGHALPTPDGRGWRRVVASPRPRAVLELDPIRALLSAQHVVAGGGGGIPLAGDTVKRLPCPAVIDKDWVAALLAIALDATGLIFVTDVPHAFDDFAGPAPRPLRHMTVGDARARLARGAFAPGSMGPKVESAVQFVDATRRPAVITTIGQIHAALRRDAGTTVVP